MELWASPYTLQSLGSPNSLTSAVERVGALLRIETSDGFGYADIHPWPVLGDAPLGEQLRLLAEGHTTALTRRSLELAKIDLEFRALRRSAFQGLEIPASHFLISDVLKTNETELASIWARGFRTLKIKMGRDVSKELAQILFLFKALSTFRLRFDFNGTLSLEDFLAFAHHLPADVRASTDFIEDPMPWHLGSWQDAHAQTGLPLAVDRLSEDQWAELNLKEDNSYGLAFQWCVLKPAVQEPNAVAAFAAKTSAKLSVTSYMDHPLGQVTAAFEAARLVASGVTIGTCGWMTHFELAESHWTRALEVSGAQLLAPVGHGFGFNTLLENENWKRL